MTELEEDIALEFLDYKIKEINEWLEKEMIKEKEEKDHALILVKRLELCHFVLINSILKREISKLED